MVKIPQHKVTKWGKFFRGFSSYFLSNPIENLQRLTIPNPTNQSKKIWGWVQEIETLANYFPKGLTLEATY